MHVLTAVEIPVAVLSFSISCCTVVSKRSLAIFGVRAWVCVCDRKGKRRRKGRRRSWTVAGMFLLCVCWYVCVCVGSVY